ncbi:MAG: hypothetical protein R3C14_39305 [Caldilineaceae bacterium]
MNTPTPLTTALLAEWRQIRQLTYDYLDLLEPHQLDLRLSFPTSQTLGYQFWCMVGAHESFLNALEQGGWQGFHSSLDDFDEVTPAVIKAQMQKSDERLLLLCEILNLDPPRVGQEPGYKSIFRMIEHEMHHHGQLINFLFCHHLPIPPSWADEWALSYDE